MNRQEIAEQLTSICDHIGAHSVMLSHAVARKVGLSTTDFECFTTLRSGGQMTAGQLSARTSLTTGAITGVVDRLEQTGFAVRKFDPTDRRRIIVSPTNKQVQRVCDLYEPLRQSFNKHLAEYNDEELAVILKFLQHTIELLRAETERVSHSR